MANYNSTLQTNNTDLQSILDKVNALPEAGSGGGGTGVETCTVDLRLYTMGAAATRLFLYQTIIDQKIVYQTTSLSCTKLNDATATISVIKGGTIIMHANNSIINSSSLPTCEGAEITQVISTGTYQSAAIVVTVGYQDNANIAFYP